MKKQKKQPKAEEHDPGCTCEIVMAVVEYISNHPMDLSQIQEVGRFKLGNKQEFVVEVKPLMKSNFLKGMN